MPTLHQQHKSTILTAMQLPQTMHQASELLVTVSVKE